jgi:hypothetical protein
MDSHKHFALHEPWHKKEDGNVLPSLMSRSFFFSFALDNPNYYSLFACKLV